MFFELIFTILLYLHKTYGIYKYLHLMKIIYLYLYVYIEITIFTYIYIYIKHHIYNTYMYIIYVVCMYIYRNISIQNTHTYIYIYIYTYNVLLIFKTTWLSVGNAFPCCCQHHCGILEWLELLAHLLEELAGGASLRATWEWHSILQQTTGLLMLVLVPLVYQKNSRY